MELQKLQEILCDMFISEDLKNAIKAAGHTFSEEECLAIIYYYAKNYDERIALWTLLEKAAPSVGDHARLCIEHQFDMLDEMKKCGEGEIYELHIKETPSSYDERYLCASFDDAMRAIDEFYKIYNFAEETEKTRYSIIKRKIYDSRSCKFDEDYIGECTFGPGKVILDIYTGSRSEYKNCGDCDECENICAGHTEVIFPNFVERFSPVRFYDAEGEVKYGIAPLRQEKYTSEYYIIVLDMIIRPDTDMGNYCFCSHEHILPPYVEKITTDEMAEEVRQRYFKVRDYWQNNIGE